MSDEKKYNPRQRPPALPGKEGHRESHNSFESRANTTTHRKPRVYLYIIATFIVLASAVGIGICVTSGTDNEIDQQEVTLSGQQSAIPEKEVPIGTSATTEVTPGKTDFTEPDRSEGESLLPAGHIELSGSVEVKGHDYPIRLSFEYDAASERIASCVYHNVSQNVSLQMTQVSHPGADTIVLQGKDGSRTFTISLSSDGEYAFCGTATLDGQSYPLYMNIC